LRNENVAGGARCIAIQACRILLPRVLSGELASMVDAGLATRVDCPNDLYSDHAMRLVGSA